MEKMNLEYAFEQTRVRADASDLDGYMEANARFHRLIAEGAHNAVLTAMVLNVRERLTPFHRYHPVDAQRITRSEDAHRAILVAIRNGAADDAYHAMRTHSVQLGAACAARSAGERRRRHAPRHPSWYGVTSVRLSFAFVAQHPLAAAPRDDAGTLAPRVNPQTDKF